MQNNENTVDTDDEIDNVFTDTDGTEIMMSELTLTLSLCMSLHHRLGSDSLLGTVGRDTLEYIANMGFSELIDENYERLFQVFGHRTSFWITGLNINTDIVEFNVSPERIELSNFVNESFFLILFDTDNPELTIMMGDISFFSPFMTNADDSRLGNTYHTLGGDVIPGFEIVVDLSGRNFYSKCFPFPGDVPAIRRLLEAAIPDVSRDVRRLSSRSFAVFVRSMRTRYAAAGLDTRIITRGPTIPESVTEQGLIIESAGKFRISVQFEGDVMDIYLSPSDVFAPHVEPEPGRDSEVTLTYSNAGEQVKFNGIMYSHTQGCYKLEIVSTKPTPINGVKDLIDAAVEIGTGYNNDSNSPPIITRCPHCGRAMGEGAMQGSPCTQCERMGRGTV
jgi:hypothetical protein